MRGNTYRRAGKYKSTSAGRADRERWSYLSLLWFRHGTSRSYPGQALRLARPRGVFLLTHQSCDAQDILRVLRAAGVVKQALTSLIARNGCTSTLGGKKKRKKKEKNTQEASRLSVRRDKQSTEIRYYTTIARSCGQISRTLGTRSDRDGRLPSNVRCGIRSGLQPSRLSSSLGFPIARASGWTATKQAAATTKINAA